MCFTDRETEAHSKAVMCPRQNHARAHHTQVSPLAFLLFVFQFAGSYSNRERREEEASGVLLIGN